MQSKIMKILAEALEISPDRINLHSHQNQIEEWDSLSHLKLIMKLEHELNISISMEEVSDLTSVEKIISIVNSKITNI
jgi:acyl carrier protein